MEERRLIGAVSWVGGEEKSLLRIELFLQSHLAEGCDGGEVLGGGVVVVEGGLLPWLVVDWGGLSLLGVVLTMS